MQAVVVHQAVETSMLCTAALRWHQCIGGVPLALGAGLVSYVVPRSQCLGSGFAQA